MGSPSRRWISTTSSARCSVAELAASPALRAELKHLVLAYLVAKPTSAG